MNKNQEKEFLIEAERNTAITQATQISDSMQFFSEILRREDANKEDVSTYLGLFEAYFKDLCETVHYDSVLAEDYKERYAEIRRLNTENQRLKNLLGTGITPEGVTDALRKYDNIFRAWYESIGFHYASNRFLGWGIPGKMTMGVFLSGLKSLFHSGTVNNSAMNYRTRRKLQAE